MFMPIIEVPSHDASSDILPEGGGNTNPPVCHYVLNKICLAIVTKDLHLNSVI